MGKGSARRPTDEAKFQANYDAIFGKKVPADAIESALKAAFWVDNCECQNPGTCSHPFCNCEVKHDAK